MGIKIFTNIKYYFSLIFIDLKFSFNDLYYVLFGFTKFIKNTNFLKIKVSKIITLLNDKRKYILKKYVYTINHKRIAINYFYFSMFTGISGAILATMIRLEMAYPGSPFFKGDSLRYLQVMTAHGLIMVFFVVIPIIFGGFANFLIPYHIGSKDVAFPRLNSIGFWIQPCGYILVAKIAFLRPQYWRNYDKTSFTFPLMDKSLKNEKYSLINDIFFKKKTMFKTFIDSNIESHTWWWKPRKVLNLDKFKDQKYKFFSFIPLKLLFWNSILTYPESFWYAASRIVKARRKKVFVSKCSDRTQTTSGWTFITPFSSNLRFTGVGAQDILIVSVIFAGISTTISFTNLLITRRTLAMPGLRTRRVLMPFITIATFLALRMLALVTPVLGAAMIMMILDRHWQTTFFEFAYGGDPILSQHLFWFFGHPEVYILIIPTFGFINMVLPYVNTRRAASKHHMIWAIYVMAYLGFLVWGHHMYLVGLDHRSRAMYSTLTIMISLPATIKMVNWTLSMFNGGLRVDIPFLFAISYILLFLVAGFTGMWLSHVALNVAMHDTFYVIAHFHLMLSGSAIVGCFCGFYYYFTALFGIKYSKFFAFLHLCYYSLGQWLTFLPQFWLGFSGLPRRVHDYPAVFMGWQSMSTTGHFVTLLGVTCFFLMLLDSHVARRIATPSHLGVPRWHKRIQYYIFKIRYLQYSNKELSILPSYKIKSLFINNYFNDYEVYKTNNN